MNPSPGLSSLRNNPRLAHILKWGGAVMLALAASTSLFLSPPGVEFTRGYFEFGLDRILFLILFFWILFNLKGYFGKALVLTFTLALFCIPLLYKWQTADYFSTLGGLLPLRDASSYFQDAQNLIHGFQLSGVSTFRPIYTSFLATVMKAVNGNLQAALIVLVALNALSVYFLANEIRRTLESGLAAAVFLILGYMFYRRFGGTLLTENLGFCLGAFALVFLIRGSTEKSLNYILYGIFLLTTGLNARAGAYMILPILVLWMGLSFSESRGFWRPFAFGVLSIALGMFANSVLGRIVSSSPSIAFSNYSYTLYGIAAGNKGWEQAGIDHPNAGTSEVYALAFEMIRDNPAQFTRGVAGAYTDYFIASKGAFSFLLMKHDRNDVGNIFLWILSLAGLIAAWVNRPKMEFSIALAFFIGILLSVGLVPPADSTQMRAYAATIPMTGYVVAVGVILPGRLLQRPTDQLIAKDESGLSLPLGISVILLASALILPIILMTTGRNVRSNPAVDCEVGRKKFTFVIADGSSISLLAHESDSFVPNIERLRLFGKLVNPEQQLTPKEKDMILAMEAGTTFTVARLVVDEFDSPPSSVGSFVITKGIPQAGVYTWCVEEQQHPGFYIAPDAEYKLMVLNTLPASTRRLIALTRAAGIWLVFIFILVTLSGIRKYPPGKKWFAALNAALIACGLVLFLHMTGLVPLAWERRVIEPEKFQHRDGFMYAYNTGDDRISDTNYRDYPAYLYEDGVLMYQPHESQSFISALGRGSYILKEKFLFFSASDNSDPETNGREYALEYPVRVRLRYQVVIFGAALAGLIFHVLHVRRRVITT